MVKLAQKRRNQPSSSSIQPAKKRKLDSVGETSTKKVRTVPKKEKAAHRKTIPIPSKNSGDESQSEVDDDDAEFFQNEAPSLAFLSQLDHKAIARSKHESDRLHKLEKPSKKKAPVEDDLPSIHSHSEDEGLWDSDIEEYLSSSQGSADEDSKSISGSESPSSSSSESEPLEVEDAYELKLKKKKPTLKEEIRGAARLPVKLSDGKIKKRGFLPAESQLEVEADSESDDMDETTAAMARLQNAPLREDISTGARFGRPAVTTVIGTKSRKARIQAAKEQLASICQEIIADPENSLGLLRRLNSFSLPKISTPTNPKPVTNDPLIRKLAFISQLAVFRDIIPGYRIRPLSDKEKEEKVSQMVQRQRDYEQGLVGVYQSFLQTLEQDIKAKTDLGQIAIQCLCTLLEELPHFNFRLNLMSIIVAQLSKRSWTENSALCSKTLTQVLKADQTGEASLELVRLLNRMVKERRYIVHPNVLSCLLHLRLKNELGVKSSDTRADRETESVQDKKLKRRKADKKYDPKAAHMSKSQKKADKERKEIEKEMHEAEDVVDREERSKTHTETLKLLFVLYFRILKAPKKTPLLPAALLGIARFAHLVNIDFFKDLLATLRALILRNVTAEDESSGEENEEGDADIPGHQQAVDEVESIRHRLMCIVTAFELLSGQGEALTIDLADFVNFLYGIILDLSLVTNIEESPTKNSAAPSQSPAAPARRASSESSMSDLLFRALSLVFLTRSSSSTNPSWRSAAFAKRVLSASLNWPPRTASQAIDFVRTLIVKDPALEGMLSTEEKVASGVYRMEAEDPQLSGAIDTANLWELQVLANQHWSPDVRSQAKSLLNFSR